VANSSRSSSVPQMANTSETVFRMEN